MSDISCGVAEALMAARAAGSLAADGDARLVAHLAACDACAALDEPDLLDALAGAVELSRNFDELAVVDPETYVCGSEIESSGAGHVIRARDRRLGRTVAIRQLGDPRLRERFEREARLTARLQHPSIVTIYEVGRWRNGELFYAMKLVAGRPLQQVVAEMATLEARMSLLASVTAVADAIAYAHSEGVVHRDLKPQHVLIGGFGETVVTDWGLAIELGGEGGGEAGVAGTPPYMAPEQALGAVPDERVDVHALGAILHHVLAGERPDLRPLPAETPMELQAIVAKATAADPTARYLTARELASELRRFQHRQLIGMRRDSPGDTSWRWLRQHRASVALSVIALIVVVIGAALSIG